jgi:ABC-type Fe3+ transport system substrate-binding protein
MTQLLVDQRARFTGDSRQLAEGLISGQFAVALGLRPKVLAPYLEQGLGTNIAFLDLPDADFVSSTSLLHFDRAPHPAAAQLFANWVLSQAGQTVLTSSLPTNSARTDVAPFQPDGIAVPGASYYEPDRQANHAHTAATQRFVRAVLA